MRLLSVRAAALVLAVDLFSCSPDQSGGAEDADRRGDPAPNDGGRSAGDADVVADEAPHAAGWVFVQHGTFRMGSPGDEPGRLDSETPHTVTLTRDFLMQPTEVTQQQFDDVMGWNPSHFMRCGPSCPVEDVTWHQAVTYCNRLSESEGLPQCYLCEGGGPTVRCARSTAFESPYECPGYRLPTEAEWEHAARAGERRSSFIGSLDEDQLECESPNPLLDPYAWYCGNSGGTTHPVGQKEASSRGLYDMLGNVWEWSHDWADAFNADDATDPWGPPDGRIRVGRGGSWANKGRLTRFAARGGGSPDRGYGYLGFRVVRTCAGEATASFCSYRSFFPRPAHAGSAGETVPAPARHHVGDGGADGVPRGQPGAASAPTERAMTNRLILMLVIAGVAGLFIGERLARLLRRRRSRRREDPGD